MQALLYVEVNMIGFVIVLTMLIKGKMSFGHKMTQRYFDDMLYIMLLLITLDAAAWWVNGVPGSSNVYANLLINTMFMVFSALFGLACLIYCFKKVTLGDDKAYFTAWHYVPCIINTVLSVISAKTGWIFYIDRNNCYQRGSLHWINKAVLFYYVIATAVEILIAMKKAEPLKKRSVYTMLAFLIMPAAGCVVQFMFFGTSIILSCCVLSILIIFMNLQNDLIITDELTKINNRLAFHDNINWRVSNPPKKGLLFLIMMDIDDFKKINDSFGHTEGDRALMVVSAVLVKVVRKNRDFVARIGGDEFAVLGVCKSEKEIQRIINEIKADLVLETEDEKFKLTVSAGFSVLDNGINSVDMLMSAADRRMYAEKKEHKSICGD